MIFTSLLGIILAVGIFYHYELQTNLLGSEPVFALAGVAGLFLCQLIVAFVTRWKMRQNSVENIASVQAKEELEKQLERIKLDHSQAQDEAQDKLVLVQTEKKQLADQVLKAQQEIEILKNDIKSKEQLLQEFRTTGVNAEILYFLGMLQEKGRFIDFVQGDISSLPDQTVGAASRIVHQGCAKVMHDYFKIVPVSTQKEGAEVSLPEDFDRADYRLDREDKNPPFIGKLKHRGWKTEKVALPQKVSGKPNSGNVITPAEVTLG